MLSPCFAGKIKKSIIIMLTAKQWFIDITLSYTAWASVVPEKAEENKGWGHPYNNHGWGEDDDEDKKGLSDKEIMKSKRKSAYISLFVVLNAYSYSLCCLSDYKKYQKKKK